MTDQSKQELLYILQTLDIEAFKKAVEIDATDDEILHAMHLVRVDHAGVNWKKKQDSRRWLEQHKMKEK